MNDFDILTGVTVIIAFVALRRVRPATFIFAGNQIVTMHALSDCRVNGRPQAQWFLPSFLFDSDRLDIAFTLFLISTIVLAVFVALPGPPRSAVERPPLPALPRWLLITLAIYFALYFFSTTTVLTTAYVDPDRYSNFIFPFAGLHALLTSLVLYEAYRRVLVGSLKPVTAFGLILVFFILLDYIKGHTGHATGYVLCLAILLFGYESRMTVPVRWLTLGASIGGVILLAVVTRAVRHNLYEAGGTAVTSYITQAVSAEQTPHSADAFEYQGGGTQYAAHVVECIALYDSGHSREWRSVYDPILYTFEPSFLLEPLGITRPKEAAWEIGEYYIGGGGIFVVGEMYWNGGYVCVAIVVALILLFSYFVDTRYRASFGWLTLLCQYAPPSLEGVGYGFAHLVRGAVNGLIVLVLYYLFRALRASRAPTSVVAPPAGSPTAEAGAHPASQDEGAAV
jgi:hypothetical protein